MSHDPRALLLSQREVADRLGQSESTIKRCRLATVPDGAVRPMPGWRNLGSDRKPAFRISEADLIAWINSAPAA